MEDLKNIAKLASCVLWHGANRPFSESIPWGPLSRELRAFGLVHGCSAPSVVDPT